MKVEKLTLGREERGGRADVGASVAQKMGREFGFRTGEGKHWARGFVVEEEADS